MKQVTLEQFFALPGISTGVLAKLINIHKQDDIVALSATDVGDSKLFVHAWNKIPKPWLAGTAFVYSKVPLHSHGPMKNTKTAQAMALVEQGLTVYAAAKQVGVDHGSVYRAIAKAKQRGTCPHCGQILPPGFTDPSPDSAGA